MTERIKEYLRDWKKAKGLSQVETGNAEEEYRVTFKNIPVLKQEFEETLQDENEAEEAVQREIEETVSAYRAGVKKNLLNRFSHLIAAKKESGRYFFMGHWLKKNEISDFYRYIKKKDNVFIFYLFLCLFILLVLNLFIVLSYLSREQRQAIFSFFSNLF